MRACRTADTQTRQTAEERTRDYLNSPEPLLREAAIAALAPELSVAEWRAALTDGSPTVRRATIQRVPIPVGPDIAPLIETARSDGDPVVATRAALPASGAALSITALHERDTLTALEKLFALRSLSLLSHVSGDALRRLAENAEERVYRAGELLCSEGETGDDVFLILEGQTEAVRRVNGKEVRARIEPARGSWWARWEF